MNLFPPLPFNFLGSKLSLLSIFTLSLSGVSFATPFISELMAANETGLTDEDGDHSDWIEITNGGNSLVNLDGYYLTDSASSPSKWRFPEVTLQAGETLLVFASNKERTSGELHSNFKLKQGGEYLGLIAPDGSTVINEFIPEYPPLGQDISFGLNPSGSQVFFNTPTPNSPNGTGDTLFVEPPAFSESSRLFTGSLSLSITSPNPAGTVHFTTDGSVPTSSSPPLISPLSITGSTTVKALVSLSGGATSRIITAHFARISSDLAGFDSNLPITVVDSETSITNFSDSGEDRHETRVFIIPINPTSGRAAITDSAQVVTRAGTNIRGNTSATKEKANYNIEFWKGQEEDLTHGSTGENIPQDRDRRVLDLPSDSDWVLYGLDLSHERSYFNNAFVYGLARDIGHPAPRTRYCEMFLNPGGSTINLADYRGIYMWVERIKATKDRLDLGKFESGETDPEQLGGYVFRSNDVSPGDLTFRTDPPYNTPSYNGNSFSIIEPNQFDANDPGRNTSENSTPADRDVIQEYVSDFERALYSNDFGDPDLGYAKYIDPRTFMIWQSLQELAANNDIYHASAYFHKSAGGRLEAGSLWDFDWAFTRPHSASPGGANPYLGWWYESNDYRPSLREDSLAPWFIRLAEHSEYSAEWHTLWADLRRSVLSANEIDSRLDGLASQLAEATVRDRAKFGGIPMTQQVSEMKSWIKGRANWMDTQLGGLPPTFNLAQGPVPNGSLVTISAGSGQSGTIYYTTNGTDPRLPDIEPSGSTTTIIIPRESIWEYLDDGSNANTAWQTTTGNGWSTGQAELGYGDNSAGVPTENTVVQSGPSGNRHITTYFRKEINITNVNEISAMQVRFRRDDGGVVYVNGTEVLRDNMPAAPASINYLTPASSSQSGSNETTFFNFNISTSAFIEGTNIIAVEIHQSSGSSSDVSFDLELVSTSQSGGPQISSSALTSPNPISINNIVTLNARTFDGSNWSPLSTITYLGGGEPANSSNLAISEIHYNPREAEPAFGEIDTSGGSFEFIEVTNIGSNPIDLAGLSFIDGVELSTQTNIPIALEAGERAVFVDDLTAFRSRYGETPRIIGNFGGNLSDSGETLTLNDALGNTIESFTYGDGSNWHPRTDGVGSSLERLNSTTNPALLTNWKPSIEVHGSPGEIGLGNDRRIAINEFLASSLPPLVDTIEFYNTTGNPIDLGGWYVSDGRNLRKYQFPPTTLAAGEFLTINENDFNASGGPNDFALDGTLGDQIYLVETDSSNKLLRFVDVADFGPTATNQSLGLIPDGTGDFQALPSSSFGASNHATTYEDWAASAFPTGTPPALTGHGADPDSDQLSNLLEFLLGLDPTTYDTSPIVSSFTANGVLKISYPRRKALAGYQLIIAVSEDLISWDRSENEITQNVETTALTSQTELITDEIRDTSATRKFFRLEAVLPLEN